MLRRPRAFLVAAVLPVVALCGCTATVSGTGSRVSGPAASASPSPSPTAEPVDTLVKQARQNLVSATRITVEGDETDDEGNSSHLLARYGHDAANAQQSDLAEFTFAGIRVTLRHVGQQTWMQAPTVFWLATEIDGAEQVAPDRWVRATAGSRDWPLFAATRQWLESEMLPTRGVELEIVGTLKVDGRPATVVTDDDGWTYHIRQGDKPVVVHAEGEGREWDLTYPTSGGAPTEAPAADLVVTLNGF